MKILVCSAKEYEKIALDNANQGRHELQYTPDFLCLDNVEKTKGYQGICCFVTDKLDAAVLAKLAENGVKLIALRSAGYDHVDLAAAKAHNIVVVRVPKYSPQAVAEFAVALILALNRKLIKSYVSGLEYNFSLEGLMGFNLYQKTVGIIGTGHIGAVFAKIMRGFESKVIAYDPVPNETCSQLGVEYVTLDSLLKQADIVSLHCNLTKDNFHLLDTAQFAIMKRGVMLINTARGGLINTAALIAALESGQVGYAGLDVYEKERGLFFIDHRGEQGIKDEQLLKLQAMPNVMITPHQAFYTEEAVANIAKTTIENIAAFAQAKTINQV